MKGEQNRKDLSSGAWKQCWAYKVCCFPLVISISKETAQKTPSKQSFEFFSRIGGINVSKGPTGFLFRNISLLLLSCSIFLSHFVEVTKNKWANMSSAHYHRQAFLALFHSNEKNPRILHTYQTFTWVFSSYVTCNSTWKALNKKA